MKILVVLKGDLNKLPPVLSVCHHLADLGHNLTVVTNHISESNINGFKAKGIDFCLINEFNLPGNIIGKIGRWASFHVNAWKKIRNSDFDILWVASADTVLALGKKVFSQKYILHVHELYDQIPRYRKSLCEYMINALKIFVPDETRAHVFRAWYQLKETPVVLPNKPYFHPKIRNVEITDTKAAEIFDKIPKNNKIVLYQGVIDERRAIKPIAKAIEELGEPWTFVIQCPDTNNEYFKDFLKNYKFVRIPYVAAPKHLELTSNVHIGVLAYQHANLNNEFCAPNKVWEYAGFGLPMIANDVFGLKHTVGDNVLGICLNLSLIKVDDIKKKILDIDENYLKYSDRSITFYESVNNKDIIESQINCLLKNPLNR